MFINFSDLPNFSNLFLDYVYEFDKVKEFYNFNFRNSEQYQSKFNEIRSSNRIPREILHKILLEQYGNLQYSKRTYNNINLLNAENTLAVVTGQQLTIFGGPLYTFYKIITAIKLCTKLKESYVDYNFVPIFWMEGDDHDFEEVNSINIFNGDNEIQLIQYLESIDNNYESGSVGSVLFDERIDISIERLKSSLRDTDFKSELIELIRKHYSNGKSFKSSFRGLLMSFFDEYGLIIFDPQDKKYKTLLKPIFENEINNYESHTKVILRRSAHLEEGYHAQVKVKPINLFFSENNKRHLIEPDDAGFKLKNKRKKFTKEEMLNLINENPEFFSPNVLMRPICQDYILPTALYIAGPSEISYFAQVIPYYNIYNITQPIIYPRASVTILEKSVKNLIEKYNLTIPSIIQDKDYLFQNILNDNAEVNTLDVFNKSQILIDDVFKYLENELMKIDNSLIDPLAKTKEKTLSHFDILKARTNSIQIKKNEILNRQLNKIFNSVFPNSFLQERVINFSYYYNKYGKEIFSTLFDEISISKFEHQIIEIGIN